ncbi:hypothetical protein TNIN_389311 [Trichonephila inaurata madagascariensis]|uniref:Uncharacterized protein n=1 Tax=Trichonephila inaurata madagascariensis TaxID=2747483 RepID=A0A8X6M9A6_9ARAC|nr:hypothetical protein TNIN_389311 [Trichonephila inaurata madagascariensis]
MHRFQTAPPHIWPLCLPCHPSFFEAILPLSSEASVSSVGQAPSIVPRRDTVMIMMTYRHTDRDQTMDNDPEATHTVSNPQARAICTNIPN